ncbi:hypothetical protein [Phytopseudomonas daroniae]|uniref:hypothetical protein n=1 Tax=Phytopseudomonas daroniae TaxID=2487519 RepID=UPI001038332A|nr:hypothetical protein [Pseudomonas daroniae]TBU78186.1 hypothetical protein DNK10_00100 [Pseudomonas daroniae]
MNDQPEAIDATDYRTRMQRCAQAYIEQHQAEHLSGDPQLLERTCLHLVHALAVPLFMAPLLAQLAMSQHPR